MDDFLTNPSSQPIPASTGSGTKKPSRGDDASISQGSQQSDSEAAADASKASSSTPVPAQTSPSENQAEGTTTGGFETMLGKVVVESGLVTSEELDLCSRLLQDTESSDSPSTLADLLIANDYATQHQLFRLRSEFEAQKSSQRIPGYKIRRKVGSGAMATVFLAHQISLDRNVAIKVLPKKFSDNANFIERFYQEGRAAAKLNHPNIVSAYDVGKAGDHHFFVMEYVDGPTIYDLIVKKKRVPEKEALEIIRQTTRALQHAHERGFIHRDIKPKNIMVNEDKIVKLADLGLARALSDKDAAQAEAGRAYGTPYYISPEQIRGDVNIGPGADLYGLGATLYHMVTGRVPFNGKNPSEVMHKHLKNELTPPDHRNPELSAGCAQVIEMMLEKDPTDRYLTASDLLKDLDLIIEGEPPYFAHKEMDLTMMTETLTSGVQTEVVKKGAVDTGSKKDTLITILLAVLGLSLLAHIVTLAMMFAN